MGVVSGGGGGAASGAGLDRCFPGIGQIACGNSDANPPFRMRPGAPLEVRIRATARAACNDKHQILLNTCRMLAGLIVLRTIAAQARFAPREALLQSRGSERNYYFTTLPNYWPTSGAKISTLPVAPHSPETPQRGRQPNPKWGPIKIFNRRINTPLFLGALFRDLP
jgi:hypothetical protein